MVRGGKRGEMVNTVQVRESIQQSSKLVREEGLIEDAEKACQEVYLDRGVNVMRDFVLGECMGEEE